MASIRMIAVLLLLAPVPAFADGLSECLDRSLREAATHGDAYCYAQESKRLDKEVEALFTEKLRQLDSLPGALAVSEDLQRQARKDFTEAHRHWAAYKDTACRFESDTNLGTGRPRAYSSCRIEMDKRRIADLQASGF